VQNALRAGPVRPGSGGRWRTGNALGILRGWGNRCSPIHLLDGCPRLCYGPAPRDGPGAGGVWLPGPRPPGGVDSQRGCFMQIATVPQAVGRWGGRLLSVALLSSTALCGCAGMSNTDKGVLGGGAIGTGAGAAIGSLSGHTGAGAVIGGLTGAVAGGLI